MPPGGGRAPYISFIYVSCLQIDNLGLPAILPRPTNFSLVRKNRRKGKGRKCWRIYSVIVTTTAVPS
jgi:hypothetical protein